MTLMAVILGIVGLVPVLAFARKQCQVDCGETRKSHAHFGEGNRPDPNKNFDMNGKW